MNDEYLSLEVKNTTFFSYGEGEEDEEVVSGLYLLVELSNESNVGVVVREEAE